VAITTSRNKGGTLTIDAHAFAKQATNVTLTPSADEDGDTLEALDGSVILPDEVTSWTLDMGIVQDFDDPLGFVEFARANAGEVVPFTWHPNATGPSYTGTVKVRAVAIGGDVNARLTATPSWPVQGQPEVDYTP
jgi:hypothetical protein